MQRRFQRRRESIGAAPTATAAIPWGWIAAGVGGVVVAGTAVALAARKGNPVGARQVARFPTLEPAKFARLKLAVQGGMEHAGRAAGSGFVAMIQPRNPLVDIAQAGLTSAAPVQASSAVFFDTGTLGGTDYRVHRWADPLPRSMRIWENGQLQVYEPVATRRYFAWALATLKFNLARALLGESWLGQEFLAPEASPWDGPQGVFPPDPWGYFYDPTSGRRPPNCDSLTAPYDCPTSAPQVKGAARGWCHAGPGAATAQFLGPNPACAAPAGWLVYRHPEPSFRYGTDPEFVLHPAVIYRYWFWRSVIDAVAPFLAMTFHADACGAVGGQALQQAIQNFHVAENFADGFSDALAAKGWQINYTQMKTNVADAIRAQWLRFSSSQTCPRGTTCGDDGECHEPPSFDWSSWVAQAALSAVVATYTGNYLPLVAAGVAAVQAVSGVNVSAENATTVLGLAQQFSSAEGSFLALPTEGLVAAGLSYAETHAAQVGRQVLAQALNRLPGNFSFTGNGLSFDVGATSVSLGDGGELAVATDEAAMVVGPNGEGIAVDLADLG